MTAGGIFIKLDAEYMLNPRIMSAGPNAELLYVRSLCLSKRLLSDGFIPEVHLKVLGLGIKRLDLAVNRLCKCGLWEPKTGGGWQIVGYLERNKSAARIRAESEAKRQASILANHERWHVGRGGKRSVSCDLCLSEPDPKPDPKPDPPSDSTETETETETENITQSSAQPTTAADTPGDGRRNRIIAYEAGERHRTNPKPVANTDAWYRTVKERLVQDHGDDLDRLLGLYPQAPDTVIAAAAFHGETQSLRYYQPQEAS